MCSKTNSISAAERVQQPAVDEEVQAADEEREAGRPGELRDVAKVEQHADRARDQEIPVVREIRPHRQPEVRLERLVEGQADEVTERHAREEVLREAEDGVVLPEEGADGER